MVQMLTRTKTHNKEESEMKCLKKYEIPTAELLVLGPDDILTSSRGFEGEEHSLLPTPFLQ